MAQEIRDTYKYHFKVGNVIVHGGISDNLVRRENEHKNSSKYTIHNGNDFIGVMDISVK